MAVTGLFLPIILAAKMGVGVGTGKIEVNKPLKAGLIYNLPSFVVLNTGDEPSNYGVAIQHRENQAELKPDKDWFSFEPQNFYLGPGQTQVVNTKLTLPVKGAVPGDYFAFLQAFPVKEQTAGASVSVAAATKLYFKIEPANFFSGIYYRILSILTLYSPWSYIVLIVILIAAIGLLIKKYFRFNFKVSIDKK